MILYMFVYVLFLKFYVYLNLNKILYLFLVYDCIKFIKKFYFA